jgi:DNA-binding NarL/FixJ family response regulator
MAIERIKILLADDHQLILDGINLLVKDAPDIDVVDEANHGEEVLDVLSRRKIDVVLMDVNMPVMDGITTTREIKENYPDVRVLALTMVNEGPIITKMLDAGAAGYILKNTNKDELLSAIRKVAAGNKYFSSDVSETMMNNFASAKEKMKNAQNSILRDHLTSREIEIIKLIVEGYSNAEIAEKLIRSPRTIDTHRTNIMKKINVHNIAGLIKYAMANGLMED